MVLGNFASKTAQQTSPAPYGAPDQQGYGYPAPPQAGARMTVDDVVMRTITLLAVTGVTAALSWMLLPPALALPLMVVGSILGLVAMLAISFMRITNPAIIIGYAVLQGLILGVISQAFESWFPGIVLQAVIGTFGVFAVMAALYTSRIVRATPFFRKVVTGALLGALVLFVVNFALSMFGVDAGLFNDPTDGQGANWFQWLLAVGLVVLAAVAFILDFDLVEQAVRAGAEQKYAWYASFGLLVGLVFLYMQLLRLISMFRE